MSCHKLKLCISDTFTRWHIEVTVRKAATFLFVASYCLSAILCRVNLPLLQISLLKDCLELLYV